MRFTDMQPWDQKVSKVPKETFPRLRINIRAVYRTWRVLELLEIISIFGKVVSSLPWENRIFGPPGEKRFYSLYKTPVSLFSSFYEYFISQTHKMVF